MFARSSSARTPVRRWVAAVAIAACALFLAAPADAATTQNYKVKQLTDFLSAGVATVDEVDFQPHPDICPAYQYAIGVNGGRLPADFKPLSGSARFTVKGRGKDKRAKGRVELEYELAFEQDGSIITQALDNVGFCRRTGEQDCSGSFTERVRATFKVTGIGSKSGMRVALDPGFSAPSAAAGEFGAAPRIACTGLGHDNGVDFKALAGDCTKTYDGRGVPEVDDIERGSKVLVAGECFRPPPGTSVETSTYADRDDGGAAVRAHLNTALLAVKLVPKKG
jgi:hypothetical protein